MSPPRKLELRPSAPVRYLHRLHCRREQRVMTQEILLRRDRAGVQRARRKRRVGLFIRDILIILVLAVFASFLVKTFLIRSFYIPSASMENTLMINDRIIVNELVPNLVPISRGDVVVFRGPGGWLAASPPPPNQPPLVAAVGGFLSFVALAAPASTDHLVTPLIHPPTQPPLVAAVEGFLSFVGLAAPDSNDHLVKRVIGLPGDHVVCCNVRGQMSVNGVPLTEPYINFPKGETKASADSFDVVVPKNSLWVMGDNRYMSKDSRYNTTTPLKGFVPVSNVVGRVFVISWPVSRWTWLGSYPDVFDLVPPAAKNETTSSGK